MQIATWRKPLRRALGPGASWILALALVTPSMPSHAIEEPDYTVVRRLADIELRQYAAYPVAEVVVPGPADAAGGQAFPILAGYISGKNHGERKLAMTAPVIQAAVAADVVRTAPAASGGFVVQFVLPKGTMTASAPEPVDPRIRIREVPPEAFAVIRYSGFWSEANYREHLAKLEEALRAADLAWTGEPVYSRYDAPFVPWFMRRNEIWLRVSDPGR